MLGRSMPMLGRWMRTAHTKNESGAARCEINALLSQSCFLQPFVSPHQIFAHYSSDCDHNKGNQLGLSRRPILQDFDCWAVIFSQTSAGLKKLRTAWCLSLTLFAGNQSRPPTSVNKAPALRLGKLSCCLPLDISSQFGCSSYLFPPLCSRCPRPVWPNQRHHLQQQCSDATGDSNRS